MRKIRKVACPDAIYIRGNGTGDLVVLKIVSGHCSRRREGTNSYVYHFGRSKHAINNAEGGSSIRGSSRKIKKGR